MRNTQKILEMLRTDPQMDGPFGPRRRTSSRYGDRYHKRSRRRLEGLAPGLWLAIQVMRDPPSHDDLAPCSRLVNWYLFRKLPGRRSGSLAALAEHDELRLWVEMMASHYWFQPEGGKDAADEGPDNAVNTMLTRPCWCRRLTVEDLPAWVWMENKFPAFDRVMKGEPNEEEGHDRR